MPEIHAEMVSRALDIHRSSGANVGRTPAETTASTRERNSARIVDKQLNPEERVGVDGDRAAEVLLVHSGGSLCGPPSVLLPSRGDVAEPG
jgi:hypothetical protein